MKNPETQKRNGVNCWEKKNTHTRGGTHLRNNENKTKRREREREREREKQNKRQSLGKWRQLPRRGN